MSRDLDIFVYSKDMDLPPILPCIKNKLEEYLLHPENLPVHQYERNQQFWHREPKPKELLYFEGSPLSTTLTVRRDPISGELTEFREISILSAGANAKNSTSMNRTPVPPTEAVRGNSAFMPFWPGSFPLPEQKSLNKSDDSEVILWIPPGFNRGFSFNKNGSHNHNNENNLDCDSSKIDIFSVVGKEQEAFGFIGNEKEKGDNFEPVEEEDGLEKSLLEEVVPNREPLVLDISNAPPEKLMKETEYAILLDTSKPVTNFRESIPEMAIDYPFTLDNFQKLAILQLEQHNHIFVAAHTSAGKTVVAEYAIALSQKHMTRTIYTSPIKALSNQKFHDFKKRFKDVGLITGDYQMNQTASCLIMTTEILRSMLYSGSDITRDLEYVIFDEVHYINDRERGHVWEQVLIMLPEHVCVVLLSATVPNTMEFADWLGRTHKRKVYVVTTSHRPVPLTHYLYTGRGGSTKDHRFEILSGGTWISKGFENARKSFGDAAPPKNHRTPAQEKTVWMSLISHLKSNNLLPVVAFTFSRQRCDNNASNLKNISGLITDSEKSYILLFFNKHIKHLKEPDQNIPQVLNMREILCKGIGVHHSGILPILKEIVEMLFHKGCIKLLFATETFAMGVNMPARTVVFDSVRKHDGKELRDLEPAEYIQMAGRAGRRGLDTVGTVIILHRGGILNEENLKRMMMGKPSSLVSQFRLTYGMVLSLLKVETLSVEGMMSRSFREAKNQKNMVDLRQEMTVLNEEIGELSNKKLGNFLQPLTKYYTLAKIYLDRRHDVSYRILPNHPKLLIPGRIVVVSHKTNVNKLAMILSSFRAQCPSYKILVLSDTASSKPDQTEDDLYYHMVGLAQDKLFSPIGQVTHEILGIASTDIMEVTNKVFKVNAEMVIRDVEKRRMERFKNDEPGPSCQEAVQELHKLTLLANGDSKLKYLHYIHDLKITEHTVHNLLTVMYDSKDKMMDHLKSVQIPNFASQFHLVFRKKFLDDKKSDIEFKMSNASLSLYPDYEHRIELLRILNYVDNHNIIQLKGRVACAMGMHELLITELVLRNILTKLKAPEVAALLSALVFTGKSRVEKFDDEGLTNDLKNAIRELNFVYNEIGELERSLQIQTYELQEELNFGLVHVVYEWAINKPFAEIMELTEIQEGIIVRCIQQLNETISDVRDAAKIIGDPELKNKMEEASTAIKRDIVFAVSLYTQAEENN